MLRLGLTGGIGAGKSTVARELERLGAVVVDADAIAREVVATGTPGLAAVVAEFGEEVLTADGALDRAALGRVVFADPAARARLEEITHPLIAAETARRVVDLSPGTVVVHDVPLIVERGLADRYDLVAVVGADEDVRLERLVRDRGMSREDALARIGAQATDAERRAVADVWLDNSGSPAELLAQVRRLWEERLLPEARRR
ncbi:dephospho-CoA kinase [Georgenia sp. Marseille-Q6866]